MKTTWYIYRYLWTKPLIRIKAHVRIVEKAGKQSRAQGASFDRVKRKFAVSRRCGVAALIGGKMPASEVSRNFLLFARAS